MKRTMLKSKIHRATVTEANLEYEGSVSIDTDLLRAADILPYEAVDIWDCTSGARLRTYAIPGEAGTGEICVNGAAAHLNRPGDLVILATYADMDPAEAKAHVPTVVRVDANNRILPDTGPEVPGPILDSRGGRSEIARREAGRSGIAGKA